MSKNAWTPGPWKRDRWGDLVGAHGKFVVFGNLGAGLVSAFGNPEAVANTTLAHEAPAMAEAIERFIPALWLLATSGNADAVAMHNEARAILARINGDAQ